MKLSRVYARFYKSFNFDNIQKAAGHGPKGDWEMFGDVWYPYVEVGVDERITAIVGANESGKSHLLTAIEKAITGEDLTPRDVCRYSDLFRVERGGRHWPHVGVAWSEVSTAEASIIAEATGGPEGFTSFKMFREGPDNLIIWLPTAMGSTRYDVPAEVARDLCKQVFPQPFRVDPNVALPSSVPLAWLANANAGPLALGSRRERTTLLASARQLSSYLSGDANTVSQNGAAVFNLLRPLYDLQQAPQASARENELQLAAELLFDLAEIDRARFGDLADAIADGYDGYANAITQEINAQIERRLNFRRWWVQDRDFSLRVSPREHELVFTIRDRTGTEYTFDERSGGLKYFLSYLIQSQAARQSGRGRILLMDEPDAHLSAEAQQDLLRIFADLAEPQPDEAAVQVIYVTHSPFLLDKNHAHRLRVLEKGRNIDGTRVIANAAQNHYEPLRSAFGAFVGEAAFVGSVNLLVEGAADQILLAGAARAIRADTSALENHSLDLNRLAIVPCSGASQIPYMVYLIRGRDAEKPPVLALLDGDEAGTNAAMLMRTDEKFRRLISRRFVIQLNEVDFGEEGFAPLEIEDLLPESLMLAAANLCLEETHEFRSVEAPQLRSADIERDGTGFAGLEAAFVNTGRELGKVAFARAVLAIAENPNELRQATKQWLVRMARLFEHLNVQRREAEIRAAKTKLAALVDARVQIFLADHRASATREQVQNFFDDVAAQLDESVEADEIRNRMRDLRRTYRLDETPADLVADFPSLLGDVKALKDALAVKRRQEPKAQAVQASGTAPTAASRATRKSKKTAPKAQRDS